jgi:hypothetical protein
MRDICREESHAEKIYKEKLSASRRDWERRQAQKKVSFYAYRDKNEIEYKWGEIFIFI